MSGGNAKKTPAPNPYAETRISGPERIIQVIEDLRTLDTDGYTPIGAGFLANIKGFPMKQTKGSVCSPFTGNVIGCAFDPNYEKKDLATDYFEPMFNGWKDPLPFAPFYKQHNDNDQPAQSVAKYNLGHIVEAEDLRRGDVMGIDWVFGGGHAAFVWDVHLDPKTGKVDCLQFVGCNGTLGGRSFAQDDTVHIEWLRKAVGGKGVTISGCEDERWFKGSAATWTTSLQNTTVTIQKKVKNDDSGKMEVKKEEVPGYKVVVTSRLSAGNLTKAKPKVFDEKDEQISKSGNWFTIPGVSPAQVAKADPTFAKGRNIVAWFGTLVCARFHYVNDPPAPPPQKPAAPTPPPPTPKTAGHTQAPAQVVKGADVKQNPSAKDKVPPKPAKQEDDKPLWWQYYVEYGLRIFFALKWIDKDPGDSQDINDSKSQAALKAYQSTLKLQVDGIIGPETIGSMEQEIPFCVSMVVAQGQLQKLYDAKLLDSDPGVADGINSDKTKAAVAEFQKKNGLALTKVPDAATRKKLEEVTKSHAPTEDKPGLDPKATQLYWVGSPIEPGSTGKLRLHSLDLKVAEACTIHLHDDTSGQDADATVTLNVDGPETVADVPIPFPAGAAVQARVVTQSAGEIRTFSPLRVGRGTETADWRPYIDQDSVPDDVIGKIKQNRALWPEKTIPQVTAGKYAGPKSYNYNPPPAHGQWARDYIQAQKVDTATSIPDKRIGQVFVLMMGDDAGSEGQPASFQTYDDQIVTWGVGFGGMGDGVHIFDQLDTDPKMQRLLDDLGVNYFKGRYHVVDVANKKVVSTIATKISKYDWDYNHRPPLKAWRDQMDLMSAIISISEDPAYRVQIIEAQWRVYVANSSRWTGHDKVHSLALFYMITHASHWLPAFAYNGFFVNKEFEAIGGGTPSNDTDAKIAQRLMNAFLAAAKNAWASSYPDMWADVHERTDTHVWARFRKDAAKEGYDPGKFVYTVDL